MNLENFDWGKTSEVFKKQVIDEIFNETNDYEKLFEVEEGDIVVDIGATVGEFTYRILEKKPKHCYVVEPVSEQFDTLKSNLEGYPVSFSKLAITDKSKMVIEWSEKISRPRCITFSDYIEENNLYKIDFLKIDCEGGEYNIFEDNISFLTTVPKIVCEFHLWENTENKFKFRNFRDNILPNFEEYEVYSIDGVNIKWDLFNEHFIDYYQEVVFYFKNKKTS